MKERKWLCQRKDVILSKHVLLGHNFHFLWKVMFFGENAFFAISENKLRRKFKFLLKGSSIG